MSDSTRAQGGLDQAWWRHGRFPAFVASRAISQAGDMAAVTAITVHIYADTASGLAVGGFFVVRVLPRAFALVGGAIGDRLELRRLLILSELVAAALFLLLAALDPAYWALLALVLLAELATTVAMPASRSFVGRTVPEDRRATANGLLFTSTAISFAAGAALGGLLASTWGYRDAVALNALTFVVSAALLLRVPRVAAEESASEGQRLVPEIRAGLRTLRADTQATTVIVGLAGVAFAAAIDRPALIVLVSDDLDGNGLGYGSTLAAIAVGAILASLGATRLPAVRNSSPAFFTAAILLQAAGHAGMGVAPVLAIVICGALIAGLGNGVENVIGTTLLQKRDTRTVGLVMGVVISATVLSDGAGSLVGGLSVELIGARLTFLFSAGLMAAFAMVTLGSREAATKATDEADPPARNA